MNRHRRTLLAIGVVNLVLAAPPLFHAYVSVPLAAYAAVPQTDQLVKEKLDELVEMGAIAVSPNASDLLHPEQYPHRHIARPVWEAQKRRIARQAHPQPLIGVLVAASGLIAIAAALIRPRTAQAASP